LRQKQLLRGNALLFHSAPQFFEKDALVRRMLIDQDEAVRIFHQDVQLAEHADDLELLRRFRRTLLWLDCRHVACGVEAALWQAWLLPYNFWDWCPAGVGASGHSNIEMW
jgi:hypothetical protein